MSVKHKILVVVFLGGGFLFARTALDLPSGCKQAYSYPLPAQITEANTRDEVALPRRGLYALAVRDNSIRVRIAYFALCPQLDCSQENEAMLLSMQPWDHYQNTQDVRERLLASIRDEGRALRMYLGRENLTVAQLRYLEQRVTRLASFEEILSAQD